MNIYHRFRHILFSLLLGLVINVHAATTNKIETKINKNSYNKDTTSSVIGKSLSPWSVGFLDIHFINTARGECTLVIMPDGTTMLVDGASSTIKEDSSIPPPPMKPNAKSKPERTIINYINHFMSNINDRLDYVVISHWHPDHIGGSIKKESPYHDSKRFKLVGLTEIGSKIKFGTLLYGNYEKPLDMTKNETVCNFLNFMDWAKDKYKMKKKLFIVGDNKQIHLLHHPHLYKNFNIRNISGNGYMWKGKGLGAINMLPDSIDQKILEPNMNILSLGFIINYGNFSYLSSGDLQYKGKENYAWLDVETPISRIVPKVNVFKANHHGTGGCNNSSLLSALSPQNIIIGVWRDVQPNAETVDRMLNVKGCNIYLTNLTDKNIKRLGNERVSKFKCRNGHILIRVLPNGNKYFIYVLDDTNEEYNVKSVYGPFDAAKKNVFID